MLKATKAAGVTLIELAIALAIIAILLSLGMPQFSSYIRDVKLRAAAENFLSGIQLARTEAIRRNIPVEFLLTADDPVAANVGSATDSLAGENWMVRTADTLTFIEGKFAVDGGAVGSVVSINDTSSPAADDPDAPPAAPISSITFNGLGRTSLTADAQFKFASPQAKCQTDAGPVRCLRVAVSVFGQARLCDPKVGAGDTRSCS